MHSVIDVDLKELLIPKWAREIDRGYLFSSTREYGIIEPIVVGILPDGKKILIDGYGRYIVATRRGEKRIKAVILNVKDEIHALEIAIELEKAKRRWKTSHYLRAVNLLREKNVPITQIARILGKSRVVVYCYIWLQELLDRIRTPYIRRKILEYFDTIGKIRHMEKIHKLGIDEFAELLEDELLSMMEEKEDEELTPIDVKKAFRKVYKQLKSEEEGEETQVTTVQAEYSDETMNVAIEISNIFNLLSQAKSRFQALVLKLVKTPISNRILAEAEALFDALQKRLDEILRSYIVGIEAIEVPKESAKNTK